MSRLTEIKDRLQAARALAYELDELDYLEPKADAELVALDIRHQPAEDNHGQGELVRGYQVNLTEKAKQEIIGVVIRDLALKRAHCSARGEELLPPPETLGLGRVDEDITHLIESHLQALTD